MEFDVKRHLGAVERSVSSLERDGQPARAVTLARSYPLVEILDEGSRNITEADVTRDIVGIEAGPFREQAEHDQSLKNAR